MPDEPAPTGAAKLAQDFKDAAATPMPVTITDTTALPPIVTFVRNAGIAIGGMELAAKLLSAHNFDGLVTFAQSPTAASDLAAAATAAGILYGAWKAWHNKAKALVAYAAAPDRVAKIIPLVTWLKSLVGKSAATA